MPAPRRSTRSAAGTGKQSTLSFSSNVTKSIPQPPGKDQSLVLGNSAALQKKKKDQDVAEVDDVIVEPEPLPTRAEPEEKDTSVIGEPDEEEEEEEVEVVAEAAPQKPAAELRAEKVSDAQVNKYWRRIEAERTAKRVHQEDLSTGEKVLRYFDVSSHYGVCIILLS